jgi:hypothetical protein
LATVLTTCVAGSLVVGAKFVPAPIVDIIPMFVGDNVGWFVLGFVSFMILGTCCVSCCCCSRRKNRTDFMKMVKQGFSATIHKKPPPTAKRVVVHRKPIAIAEDVACSQCVEQI